MKIGSIIGNFSTNVQGVPSLIKDLFEAICKPHANMENLTQKVPEQFRLDTRPVRFSVFSMLDTESGALWARWLLAEGR